MFIVANRVPVAAGWEETFEERFRKRIKGVGVIKFKSLRPLFSAAIQNIFYLVSIFNIHFKNS